MNGVENMMSRLFEEEMIVRTSERVTAVYKTVLKKIISGRQLSRFLSENDWATSEDFYSMIAQEALNEAFVRKLELLHWMARCVNDRMDEHKIHEFMSTDRIINITEEIRQDIKDGYYDDSQILLLIERNMEEVRKLSEKKPDDFMLELAWGNLFLCGVEVRQELEK